MPCQVLKSPHLSAPCHDKIHRKCICRRVLCSLREIDFLQDESNFLKNIQIFKKNSAKYCRKDTFSDLLCSTPVWLTALDVHAKNDKFNLQTLFRNPKSIHALLAPSSELLLKIHFSLSYLHSLSNVDSLNQFLKILFCLMTGQ